MEKTMEVGKRLSGSKKENTKTDLRGFAKLKLDLKKNFDMYLLLLPGLALLIIFKYIPMYGVSIAFQDFSIFKGIGGSDWVGWANFAKLFSSEEFFRIFKNTLLISLYKLAVTFPLPIFIALVLNEIKRMTYKKVVQTVIYMPHFLSWVVVAGMFTAILSTSNGLINNMITSLGGEPIPFMMSKSWFRTILVTSEAWKGMGWGAIIYIAAISGIDQEMYEAAALDGAGRIRQIIHITLPNLASTIVLMLILRLGSVLNAGTEQILMMYNPAVYEVGDVIGTYVYRMGIGKMDYSFSTAVGLFNSVVGCILVMGGNYLSGKLTNKSIW